MTTLTSREFNQNAGRAKLAALDGPVFITDRGKPAHVLLTMEEYQRLTGSPNNLAEMLACPESDGINFEPEMLSNNLLKTEDFS